MSSSSSHTYTSGVSGGVSGGGSGGGTQGTTGQGNGGETREGQYSDDIGGQKLLACPFHKLDPRMHRSCEHYHLTNWYHTLQHLSRVHALVDNPINNLFYCVICRIRFKGKTAEREWQLHSRAQQCQTASMEETGMILPEEFVKLKRLSTGNSSEEKWFAGWEILFPLLDNPSSAYFESQVDLLRRHASEKMRSFIRCDDPAMINAFVNDIFTPPVIPHKVAHSQIPGSGINASPNHASGSAHVNNWFVSQPDSTLPFLNSPSHYPSGFAQDPAMAPSFDFPTQPMVPCHLPEGTFDIDNLHVDHDEVFAVSSALQPGEDWGLCTEQGYVIADYQSGSPRPN